MYTHSVKAQDHRGGGSTLSWSNAFCFMNADTRTQAVITLLVYSACENQDYFKIY